MSKELIIGVVATFISLISLAIASYSLKISIDAEKRNQSIFENSVTSILIANYDKDKNSLSLSTSEDSKLLSFGHFVFPDALSIEPISFSSPKNEIPISSIEPKLLEALQYEGYILYKQDPKGFKNVVMVIDFVVPIYSEYQSTSGGDSVISKSSYNLIFSCSLYEEFVLSDSLPERSNCIYKTLVHDGRVSIEGFYLFHWPWASDEEIAAKVAAETQKRIMTLLNGEWSYMRPSVRYKIANK